MTKGEKFHDNEPAFVQLSEEQKIELMKAKYPDPLPVTIKLTKDQTSNGTTLKKIDDEQILAII